LQVQFRGPLSGIHEVDDQSNGRTYPKVLLNQTAPFPARGLSCLGVAISRQIHQAKITIEPVKIDALSFARCGACPGNALFASQAVDQAGFSNIRSSRNNYLGDSLMREILFRDSTRYEFSLHGRGMRHWFDPLRRTVRAEGKEIRSSNEIRQARNNGTGTTSSRHRARSPISMRDVFVRTVAFEVGDFRYLSLGNGQPFQRHPEDFVHRFHQVDFYGFQDVRGKVL
jgi:hypothetical protein